MPQVHTGVPVTKVCVAAMMLSDATITVGIVPFCSTQQQ